MNPTYRLAFFRFLPPIVFLLPAFYSFGQQSQILLKDARLETLFDGRFFLEGPAVAPDGRVYFSDITFTSSSGMQAGHVWRYDPKTKKTEIFRSPSGMSNGILFDRDGNMIAALGADFGGRQIVKTDMKSGKSTILAAVYDGKRLNSPNDLVLDARGRIYFSDPRYAGQEPLEQPVEGVYRIDPDGSLHRIIDDNGKPNGILVSPDQKHLYVASAGWPVWSEFNGLVQYDLDTMGNVSNRKILIKYDGAEGIDGMAIDTEGNLYAARPCAQPGIYIYSANGAFLDRIPTPEAPTNVCFGHGPTSNYLYITAGKKLYGLRVQAKGFVRDY